MVVGCTIASRDRRWADVPFKRGENVLMVLEMACCNRDGIHHRPPRGLLALTPAVRKTFVLASRFAMESGFFLLLLLEVTCKAPTESAPYSYF